MAQQSNCKIKQLDPLNVVARGHGKNGIQVELLTFGFVRKSVNALNKPLMIPKDVTYLICDFGEEWNCTWFSIFDEIKSEITLKQDEETQYYQLLKGNNYNGPTQDIMFISSTGFDCGVHDIVLRCIRCHPNDKIGIVQNATVEKLTDLGKIYLYNSIFGHRYYWWKHTHNVWKGSNYFKKINDFAWTHGDTIKMRLDCDHWTMQFFYKAENAQEEVAVLEPLKIEKDIKYYPVLTNGDTKACYHHILPKSFQPKV